MRLVEVHNNVFFALKANLGFVIRGSMNDLSLFAERIESLCKDSGLTVVHKHASASKLWIKEGDIKSD
jgi:hypothetical protein